MEDIKFEDESLMDSINTLFAPPSAESQSLKGFLGIPKSRRILDEEKMDCSVLPIQTNKFSDDPAWKKPKANSHDYCDSCGCTEGERLVCDRCPVSFHLECLDPPMDSDEATTGIWYCPSCTVVMKEDDNTSNCSDMTDNTRMIKEYQNITFSLKQQIKELVDHQRSTRSNQFNHENLENEVDENIPLFSLWEIVRQTKYLNPKEFDLPKDLVPGIKFPGSFKTPNERKKKSIIELECGQIPRPVMRCYVCKKTCLLAPLLCCDFCESAYHLNCLDPPRTHYPPRLERWMCPLHAEYTIDNHFVKSIRLSDRMQQWDRLKYIEPSPNIDKDILSQGDTYNFPGFSKQDETQIIKQFMYRINQDRLRAVSEKIKLEDMTKKGKKEVTQKVQMNGNVGKVRVVVPPAVKSLYKKRVKPIKSDVNASFNYVVESDVIKFLASLLDEKKPEEDEEMDTDNHKKETMPKNVYQIKSLPSRAMIVPLDDTSGPVFHMQYKQMKIGTGVEASLRFDMCQLKNLIKCSRISHNHAHIFFDEQTRLFELINYSEKGSMVDNILYGFNREDFYALESNDLSKRAREIIGDSKNDQKEECQEPPLFTPKKKIQTQEVIRCSCEENLLSHSNDETVQSGWEGSAILHHGSLLKFGCYQFVFSIISN